jgi:outer membrane lipoprotein-sorting protein
MTMNFRRISTGLMALSMAVAGCCGVSARAQQQPWDLESVLHQMDVSGANFKSAQADVKKDLYERVVKETTTQKGTIYYQRTGTGVQMGAKFDPPTAKIVEVKDGMVRLFDPNTNHLTQISIKKNQNQYESFLTIGFGGSGTDLAKHWTINYMGIEPLSDGKKMVPTAKLDLVAKDPEAKNVFTHITIWVDPTLDVSLKQQFFQPSGDIQTATYTNIRYNQLKKPDMDAFAIKTDKKTSVDTH